MRCRLLAAVIVVAPLVVAVPHVSALPFAFEKNTGQFSDPVRFVLTGPESTLFLFDDRAVVKTSAGEVRSCRFVGSSHGELEPEGLLPGVTNYLVGRDPSGWSTGVSRWQRIIYRSLYPGIDLVWRFSGEGLEYDFLVSPSADPSVITLEFNAPVSVGPDGSLTLADGLIHRRPIAWQETADAKIPVDVAWRIVAERRAVFSIGQRDLTQPLVIDPILEFSTYFGGNSSDYIEDVAVASDGTIVVVGTTYSSDLPLENAFQTANLSSVGERDAFIARFDSSGSTLLSATYFGGSGGRDIATSVALGSDDSIFITGETHSVDLPVTPGAFQEEANWWVGDDGFVAKLSAAGDAILFSTFFAALSNKPSQEFIRGIAVDSAGSPLIVGSTTDPTIPVTQGAFRTTGCGGLRDAFVSKLNSSGTDLVYSTYICGSENDEAWDVALDPSGSAVVVGRSFSPDFPLVGDSPPLAGATDVFVAKVSRDGSSLEFSRYLGGSGPDRAEAVALGDDGSIHVVGKTSSSDFPTTSGAVQPTYGGSPTTCRDSSCGDGFYFALDSRGTLLRATYLGGNRDDYATAVAVDSERRVHIVGTTSSTNFRTLDSVSPFGGDEDAFLVLIGPTGALIHSSTLGGGGIDRGSGVAVTSDGSSVVVGQTSSTNFPIASPWDGSKTPGDNSDGFLAKISSAPAPPPSGRRRALRRP